MLECMGVAARCTSSPNLQEYLSCLRLHLRFADDTTLLFTSKEELLGLLKKVKEASMSKNFLLNTQKTKIMVVDKDRERKEDFVLDGEKI